MGCAVAGICTETMTTGGVPAGTAILHAMSIATATPRGMTTVTAMTPRVTGTTPPSASACHVLWWHRVVKFALLLTRAARLPYRQGACASGTDSSWQIRARLLFASRFPGTGPETPACAHVPSGVAIATECCCLHLVFDAFLLPTNRDRRSSRDRDSRRSSHRSRSRSRDRYSSRSRRDSPVYR